MINLSIIGNLTADPETRTSQTGKTVVTFTVAEGNPRDKEHPTFVRVTAWDKLGEVCATYLAKGKKVYVSGRPSAHGYSNKQGNISASLEVTAQNVEFLSASTQSAPQTQTAPAPQEKRDPLTGFTFSDEDLPF